MDFGNTEKVKLTILKHLGWLNVYKEALLSGSVWGNQRNKVYWFFFHNKFNKLKVNFFFKKKKKKNPQKKFKLKRGG